jgi:hypothetical protein
MTARTTGWKRRKTTALFAEQGGLCWWCGCETILMVGKPIQPVVRNRATIDHLRDRTNPTRSHPCIPGEKRIVMACWECNNERGNAVGRAVQMATGSRA